MLQTIVGGVLVIIAQLCTAVVMLLRFLPQLTNLVVLVLRGIVAASCLAYRASVERAAPIAARAGIDLSEGWRRWVVCVCLSLIFGTAGLFMAQWVITPLALGVCIAHGLVVHLAWDQLGWPTGLHLGV